MSMEDKQKFIVNVAYYAMILVGIALVLKIALPAAIPFIIGFIIALLLLKPIRCIHKNLRVPYKLSAIVVVAWFYIVIGLILASIGVWGWYAVEEFVAEIPNIYVNYIEKSVVKLIEIIETNISRFSNNSVLIYAVDNVSEEIMSYIGKVIPDLSTSAISSVTNIAKSVPGIFIKVVLIIISTFFVAVDYNQIMGFFKRIFEGRSTQLVIETKNFMTGTILVVLKSYLTIMTITFIELSIGLMLIGVDNFMIIALAIAIFDILPVLGTGGVMIPWAIINVILGDFSLAIKLLLLYLIITVIRNVIEPKIVGKQLGLHPLVTLVTMFIGLQLAGVIGMFGLPVALSLICHLNNKEIIHLSKRIT